MQDQSVCAPLLGCQKCLNAANHLAIFIVLEAKGFPSADNDLIRRLYYRSFLSIGNVFGETPASA